MAANPAFRYGSRYLAVHILSRPNECVLLPPNLADLLSAGGFKLASLYASHWQHASASCHYGANHLRLICLLLHGDLFLIWAGGSSENGD